MALLLNSVLTELWKLSISVSVIRLYTEKRLCAWCFFLTNPEWPWKFIWLKKVSNFNLGIYFNYTHIFLHPIVSHPTAHEQVSYLVFTYSRLVMNPCVELVKQTDRISMATWGFVSENSATATTCIRVAWPRVWFIDSFIFFSYRFWAVVC